MSETAATPDHADGMRSEAVREAVSMALYQSLSLLAVLLATPEPDADRAGGAIALTVALTGIGLLLAHTIAFRLSSRLMSSGDLTPEARRLVGAQLRGALPVVVVAALPPLFWGSTGLIVSEALLLLFVAVTGYLAVRQGHSRVRSLVYLAGLLVMIVLLMVIKTAVGH